MTHRSPSVLGRCELVLACLKAVALRVLGNDLSRAERPPAHDLGPKSVVYQRIEELADPERIYRELPHPTAVDNEVGRALYRQDLDTDREKVEIALGQSLRYREALPRVRRRVSRAHRPLRKYTLTTVEFTPLNITSTTKAELSPVLGTRL